jgi:hypothetical protein
MNNDKQHLEDTKYVQWEDGMYVMLDDLADPLDLQGYALALVENSLRCGVYCYCVLSMGKEDCLGVWDGDADYWNSRGLSDYAIELTRAQALYIATGDVNI